MTKDQLLKVIETAARTRTTKLDLSGYGLSELPAEIGQLSNLSALDLSKNQLHSLPVELTQLTKLSQLYLSENQLSYLPAEIGQLTNLSRFALRANQLSRLPAEIGQLTNLAWLDLSANQLTSLPTEIGQLVELSWLYLRANQLGYFPAAISQLTNLPWLDLSANQLDSLPPEIGELTKLWELDLKANNLDGLPPEITKLKNLSILDLRANQFKSLPAEIAQLISLWELDLSANQLSSLPTEIAQLINLLVLNLSANQLSSLPTEIAQLAKLCELDLRANQLNSLPVEIGQLTDLAWLDLSVNQLSSLAKEIAQLTNLSVLYIRANQLDSVPAEIGQLKNLSQLDLSSNQLRSLPEEIAQLTNLSRFYLRKNPHLSIPPEIVSKVDVPAIIINYYLQNSEESSRQLNEAKVLFVGEAKVGKTSLAKRLIDGTFDASERMTEGINIRDWIVTAKNQQVKLNVWDFGGQEIMHATHQFFLTKRSLYLLILSARQDEDANRIEYWLKIIRSFSDNSPVIIVGNQVDQKPLDIDRRGLKKKYPNIVRFIETSCSNLKHKGIEKLKREIQQQIANQPHVFDSLPASWFAVKDQLEKLDADYIEYHQYQHICQSQNITQEQNQKTLVGFLHDLGIALNFSDDPRLKQDNILNPEWVTNGVYSILNDNALMTEHKGILERSMLHRILDKKKYPADKHLFILDIMRKFELCFPLEGYEDKNYLLPDLLSKEEPETGDWNDILPFQYHYNILPGSVISRFIVRMNQLISKRTYWRNGVVLTKGVNKALVKADKEDRKMFVWVSGNQSTRRILLESIRDQFDYIHSSIPGLEVDEKVPLPSNPNVLVDYKNLLDMEEMGVEDFVPSGLRQKVRVRDLLEGIESSQNREERQESRKELEQRFPPPAPIPNLQTTPLARSHTPWGSGLFYLFVLFIVTALFAIVSRLVPWYILPIVIIGALLSIGVIGAFQLMQDERFSEEKFVTLIIEAYKRLPLLRGQDTKQLSSEENTNSDS
ncbi:small gtp-binding protein [Leptolyngbya sp. Heron Island J]|nr:small gtp-binding protein [Leptolyngbya sp. Heron Island J]